MPHLKQFGIALAVVGAHTYAMHTGNRAGPLNPTLETFDGYDRWNRVVDGDRQFQLCNIRGKVADAWPWPLNKLYGTPGELPVDFIGTISVRRSSGQIAFNWPNAKRDFEADASEILFCAAVEDIIKADKAKYVWEVTSESHSYWVDVDAAKFARPADPSGRATGPGYRMALTDYNPGQAPVVDTVKAGHDGMNPFVALLFVENPKPQ